MKAQPSGVTSIWGAALMAANCEAVRSEGRPQRVRWQQRRDSMRYVARANVEVEPLGVRLAAGDVLEVRWEPNQTGYTLAVRSAH
jgi:hypothetical protein